MSAGTGTATVGGAFLPDGNYHITGNWVFTNAASFSGSTLTAPTITSPTITGTTTIGAGATLTSPTLVTPALGVATGTSVVLSGDCKAATFHAGSTAGVTAGPFTTVGSINVTAGLVTTLTGS